MRTRDWDDASILIDRPGATARLGRLGCVVLFAVGCMVAVGVTTGPAWCQATAPAAPPQNSPAKSDPPGFLDAFGKWLSDQADNLNSSFKDAGKKVQSFGKEAGSAAQSTVEGAKDAADAMVRIPAARVVSGHEKCRIAPNGAPDCVAAATAMCKAKGFESGKSADMTTAESCPPSVYLAGRRSGPECRTETFVSRALCQ